MQVRKVVLSSVVGVGMTGMALAGAGSAFAGTGDDGPQWGNGHPVSNIVKTVNSYNSYDDHSINVGNNLLAGNTVNLTIKVVALNGNKIGSGNHLLNGNKLFSGNKTPILNGNQLFGGGSKKH